MMGAKKRKVRDQQEAGVSPEPGGVREASTRICGAFYMVPKAADKNALDLKGQECKKTTLITSNWTVFLTSTKVRL